ncbi:hypothetical protein TNCV_4496561 [Trichonephila clavipes]|nr:hypothetical protein TNCV_4496561 [Trichonephila clavipes]
MSSFLVLYEGDTRNRWRDGQVCPDVDKELWCLGPDGSGVFWRVMRKLDEGGEWGKKEGDGERKRRKDKRVRERERTEGEGGKRVGDGKRESGRERAKPALNGEKGLSPEIGVKKTMNAGDVENGNMN